MAILSLRLLSEVHREFAQPPEGVYVDLKVAFDSLMDRDALWSVEGQARYSHSPEDS